MILAFNNTIPSHESSYLNQNVVGYWGQTPQGQVFGLNSGPQIVDTLVINLPVNCVLDGQQDNMEEGFPKSRARSLDSLPVGMKSIFGE